ncbi:MAG: ATP-binding protein [Leptolyngbyaceae cyanobacterium bins.349]|nr:ATP-binding protein [Leptolyngbyaceae cyanobacterium bins.349]
MDPSSSVAQNQQLEPETYHLVLKNKRDQLDRLSEWINQVSSQLHLSSRGAFRLELSLVEAVTNVIEHAYQDEADHEITLVLNAMKQTVRVEIKDDGQPFNPLQHPPIVLPTSLEEAKEGGLGIHLIRNYVNEWLYQREGPYNILTLLIHDVD